MEIAEHIAALRHEGDLMTKAIGAAAAEARIPTCPEWTMRDLVLHQGEVHRWARTVVTTPSTSPPDKDVDIVGPLPDDAGLAEWFGEGCDALVDALESADPDLECWSFLKAPSPLAFWARRQCHETGIHRADAESATGAITPFPSDVAADGIDELLTCFVTRSRSKLTSDTPRALLVQPNDIANAWLVRISDHVETERSSGAADCTISGSASDLHLFLWNRTAVDGLDVAGDASLLELWRDRVTIRWS